jgi:hypothetical protein
MSIDITYKISLYESKSLAYQQKNIKKKKASIKLFISQLWKDCDNFGGIDDTINQFVKKLIYYTLIERVCLEYAFNNIRCGRCNEIKRNGIKYNCFPEYIVGKIIATKQKL